MSCCFNPTCRKPFTFFSRKWNCLICKKKYCRDCYQKSQLRGVSGGYCLNCYTNKNPDNIKYPEQFGNSLLAESIVRIM